MATRAELVTARAAAGAAYAAAAQAYVDAWVELAAHDGAVGNNNIRGVSPGSKFNAQPEVLMHPEFLPAAARDAMVSPGATGLAAGPRAEAIIRSWDGN
jgi:hypothetical protein